MIYIQIHDHVMKFDNTPQGIKEMSQYFPMVREILMNNESKDKAMPDILRYLNSHHIMAWVE